MTWIPNVTNQIQFWLQLNWNMQILVLHILNQISNDTNLQPQGSTQLTDAGYEFTYTIIEKDISLSIIYTDAILFLFQHHWMKDWIG